MSLRADPTLQVFVNDEHIAACVDATFGFGWFGWRIEPTDVQASRAILHSVSLYAVA